MNCKNKTDLYEKFPFTDIQVNGFLLSLFFFEDSDRITKLRIKL